MRVHKFNAPKEIKIGEYKIEQHNLNNMLEDKFNSLQYFLDEQVIVNLQPYVAFRTGAMEKSIKTSSFTRRGEGQVAIDTKYAAYQAYSPRIHKMVDKRGPYPFERMCSDKGNAILNDVAEESRRLFG